VNVDGSCVFPWCARNRFPFEKHEQAPHLQSCSALTAMSDSLSVLLSPHRFSEDCWLQGRSWAGCGEARARSDVVSEDTVWLTPSSPFNEAFSSSLCDARADSVLLLCRAVSHCRCVLVWRSIDVTCMVCSPSSSPLSLRFCFVLSSTFPHDSFHPSPWKSGYIISI